MTEINDHKTFWKRSTMEIITYTEGSLADIIQLARKDILSLITTIESQKEEIKKKKRQIDWLQQIDGEREVDFKLHAQSLKTKSAITELAVKRLKEISNHHPGIADNTLSEIERLSQ